MGGHSRGGLLFATALPTITQPRIWSMRGTLNATTAGAAGNITLTGANFINAQCGVNGQPLVYIDNTAFGYGYATNRFLNVTVNATGTQIIAGPIPEGTGAPRIRVVVCGQTSLDLPRFPADMLFWQGGGVPMAPAACTKMSWVGGSASWIENYFCSSDERALNTETTGNVTNLVPIFRWYTGVPPATQRCTKITSAAPGWNTVDKWICVPTISPYFLTWSQTGAIPGKKCIPWRVANENNWDNTLHQLCADVGVSPYPESHTFLQYQYAPPLITSSSPSSGPTSGSASVTLIGSSFGFPNVTTISFTDSTGVVSLCALNAALSDHYKAVCGLPSGVGLNVRIQMNQSTQLSSIALFSYDPPTISGFTPATISTDGSTILTVR